MKTWSRPEVMRIFVLTAGRAASVVVVAALAWQAAEALSNRGRTSSWVWLAATLLVALTATLTRRPLERLADRVAYGPRGDPYAVLSGFVERISDTLAVDDVLPHVARTVTQALRSPRGEVRLWLADGEQERRAWPVDAVGGQGRKMVDVPLQHHGHQVGELDVAVDDELSNQDRALLGRLAGTAGLALANVRLAYDLRHQIAESTELAHDLARSRRRLVTAAAEQTRRFSARVDHHVQHRLTRVEVALAELAGGDTAAVLMAKHETTSALAALREIAAGVFPPALADRGLGAAVEMYGLAFDGRVTARIEGSQRGPLPLESAAYFCLVQLVEDCVSSGEVRIVVGQSPDALRLRVTTARPPGEDTLQLLTDRVAATDGHRQVRSTTPYIIEIDWGHQS